MRSRGFWDSNNPPDHLGCFLPFTWKWDWRVSFSFCPHYRHVKMRFKTLLLVSIPLGRNPMWSVFKKSHFTRFYNCGGVRFWPNSHVRTDEMRLRKGLNTHRSRNTGTGRFESGTDLHGMDRSWPGKNYLNHMDRSWAPVEFSGVLNSGFFGKDLFAWDETFRFMKWKSRPPISFSCQR